jgi:hypothetical protein
MKTRREAQRERILWNVLSSRIYHHVVRLKSTDVSEQPLCLTPNSLWFLDWLILCPWRQRWYVPPKRLLSFNGLHGVISQKTELFIMADVRTSNPTAAVHFSETSVNVYRTTRRHTPEDSTIDIHHCENLSSVYTHVFIPRHSFHTGKLARHISR